MSEKYPQNKDDLNIPKILRSVLRFKKVFVSAFLLSTLLSAYITSKLQKEWEGTFQIVLKRDAPDKKGGSSASEKVSNILAASDSSLNTEVEILGSPSVLKPVYDYVMQLEYDENSDLEKQSYKDWFEDRLEINLIRGTQVLEVIYRSDEDKSIKPVLNKISQIYQEYSGNVRRKELDRTVKYLKEQVDDMRKKSFTSLTNLQAFAIENNLGSSDGIPSFEVNPNYNARNFNDGNISRFKDQFAQLAILENRLAIKSTLLTSDSKVIKELKRKISSLKKSLSRPKEILIKYRTLKRIAIRDEEILNMVELKLNTVLLEKALDLNPWELISEPTLFAKNLNKQRTDTFSAGLVISLLIGIIASYNAQKISGRIYSYYEISEIINLPLLKTIKTLDSSKWVNSFQLLLDGPLLKKNDASVGIISIGNFSDSIGIDIKRIFAANAKNQSIDLVNNLSDLKKYDKKLAVIGSGFLTKDQLLSFKEEYKLCNFEIEGVLYFDV